MIYLIALIAATAATLAYQHMQGLRRPRYQGPATLSPLVRICPTLGWAIRITNWTIRALWWRATNKQSERSKPGRAADLLSAATAGIFWPVTLLSYWLHLIDRSQAWWAIPDPQGADAAVLFIRCERGQKLSVHNLVAQTPGHPLTLIPLRHAIAPFLTYLDTHGYATAGHTNTPKLARQYQRLLPGLEITHTDKRGRIHLYRTPRHTQ